MTDIAKALAFATYCLGWKEVETLQNRQGTLIYGADAAVGFYIDNRADLQSMLELFLGNSYFIQINRGTSSLFHWRVIVGWQDGTDRSKSFERGVGVGEDLWDAVFDACVQAASLG